MDLENKPLEPLEPEQPLVPGFGEEGGFEVGGGFGQDVDDFIKIET